MIPYGRQEIIQDDIDAVVDIMKSEFLTQGPVVQRFESAVSNHVGALHAVAVNSATSALHIACLALGLGPGDSLWTSPITFVASANCGLYCGAKVDFVDIDPYSYNLSPQALENKLIEAEKKGVLPKIVIAVHFAGQSCDMESIYSLSKKYGFKIIEDASHAIGGKYKNEFVGCCRFSDVTVFSFHPVKIITTAEGGMALTNDPSLAKKMERLRSHGITRDPTQMENVPDGPWYYEQIELGYNYRMTEIQAALGLSQMQRLDSYVSLRHEIASKYKNSLSDFPIITPKENTDCYSAYHLYVIRLNLKKNNFSHRQIFEMLRTQNIGVNLHYIPVYRQPYYKRLGFSSNNFPEAERYYSDSISLPIFPSMGDVQQDRVVIALKKIYFTK